MTRDRASGRKRGRWQGITAIAVAVLALGGVYVVTRTASEAARMSAAAARPSQRSLTIEAAP